MPPPKESRKQNASSSETAARLNSQLPLKLTTRDVELHPEFSKLLYSLSSYMSPHGTSAMAEKELKDAEDVLKHEKSNWIQQHILHSELTEMLMEQQLNVGSSTPSSSGQFYKAVGDCLTYAEIGDYLKCHPDPTSGSTLLGLSEDDIKLANPSRKHSSSLQQKLIPELEQRLRKKGETLVNFHDTTGNIESGKFAFAKTSQLPALLEAEKQEMETEQADLNRDKEQREKQFWQYYQTLMDSLGVLEHLIKKYRLQSQSESDTITAEWLTARCDAMCLKIKTLEYQLLCDTYYDETVRALTTIKNQLDLRIHETQKDLRQVGQSLQAYEAVGTSFDSLVEDYTKLRDEIDNKKWGLRELKHSIDTPGIPGFN